MLSICDTAHWDVMTAATMVYPVTTPPVSPASPILQKVHRDSMVTTQDTATVDSMAAVSGAAIEAD